MPRGNRLFLLVALLVLWVFGVAFLLGWYVAFAGFDGYEANIPLAVVAYGGVGLAVVALLYFGIGALLNDGPDGRP